MKENFHIAEIEKKLENNGRYVHVASDLKLFFSTLKRL